MVNIKNYFYRIYYTRCSKKYWLLSLFKLYSTKLRWPQEDLPNIRAIVSNLIQIEPYQRWSALEVIKYFKNNLQILMAKLTFCLFVNIFFLWY